MREGLPLLCQCSITPYIAHFLQVPVVMLFLGSISNWQADGAARDGSSEDDDFSSLREKLFIGFFSPYAEY